MVRASTRRRLRPLFVALALAPFAGCAGPDAPPWSTVFQDGKADAPPPCSAGEQLYGVTTNTIGFRAEPSTEAARKTYLTRGSELLIDGYRPTGGTYNSNAGPSTEWLHVWFRGEPGWAAAAWIEYRGCRVAEKPPTPGEPLACDAGLAQLAYVRNVDDATLRVRSEPKVDGELRMEFRTGAAVRLTGKAVEGGSYVGPNGATRSDWLPVENPDGTRGFAAAAFLAVDTACRPRGREQAKLQKASHVWAEYVWAVARDKVYPLKESTVAIAARELDGKVLAPGQTFSFNEASGLNRPRYGRACTSHESCPPSQVCASGSCALFNDGWSTTSRWVYAGGVCGMATTVYRASLLSGLPILEQWTHGIFYWSNLFPGVDAEVWSPTQDFQFRNDTPDTTFVVQSFSQIVDGATPEMRTVVRLVGTTAPDREVKVGPLSFNAQGRNGNGGMGRYEVRRTVTRKEAAKPVAVKGNLSLTVENTVESWLFYSKYGDQQGWRPPLDWSLTPPLLPPPAPRKSNVPE
ncbi:MAG: VanW family protein [Deltaproteobacteria bacterium]|nr:VanW family protein [Deltaproteobacteria bacterium]